MPRTANEHPKTVDAQQVGHATCDLVIVTHNSAADLRRNWVDRRFPDWLRVVIVDNGSADESLQVAGRIDAQVLTSTNVGLSRSNNAGAQVGNGDYLIFCNPDIDLTPAAVEALLEGVRSTGGLVAPRLVFPDGRRQPNGRRWPSLPRILANRLLPRSRLAGAYNWPPEGPDWVTGACVAMDRETFEAVGGWPEPFFLYFEDVELSWRFRSLGLPVVVLEQLEVPHDWKRSSTSLFGRTTRLHVQSALRFYARHPMIALFAHVGRRAGGK